MSARLAAFRRTLPGTVLLALAACAPPLSEQWQSASDGAVANVVDISDCRSQARRQALLRYPRQPIEENVRTPRLDEPARADTEGILFRACMRQNGFVLMVVPPP